MRSILLARMDSCAASAACSSLGSCRVNLPPRAALYPPRSPPCRQVSQAIGASSTFENVRSLMRSLVQFRKNTASLHQLDRLRQLVVLLQKHPEAAEDAWNIGVVPTLVELKDCGQLKVEHQARMALSLLGYAPPYSGRGIRILAVDGGGTRGLVPIRLLKHLEEMCGLKTHQMFDYVCGTSTGAILVALLCMKRSSIEEVEDMYRELSTQVFKMNNLLGIGQLFLNHAFYDCKLLEKIFRKDPKAEQLMFETAADPLVPKTSFVSTVVNQPVVQPFLFCNYRHHPTNSDSSHYLNATNVRIWEAMMASTAAPGYFEEVKLGAHMHQDGGLLTNNPTAIALHEARLLWGRNAPIQCIVSLGTGMYLRSAGNSASLNNTSLREKLTKLVASATDTEAVHILLKDLLPPSAYFRFNPELSEDIPIDESNPDKLKQLVEDTNTHINVNRGELERAAACLLDPKKPSQKAQEWMNFQWNKVLNRTHHLLSR